MQTHILIKEVSLHISFVFDIHKRLLLLLNILQVFSLFACSDRSPDVDNDSDEDEVHDYNEFSSNDEMSDSEPMMIDEHHRPRKPSRIKARPATTRVC